MSELLWLDPLSPIFPDTSKALRNPDGLLAAGGNLHTDTLHNAYSKGIFPWFSEGEPILWWAPSIRAVLFPEHLSINRGSRKQLRKLGYCTSSNQVFGDVISACAQQRKETGTWITDDMISAYQALHSKGIAQSVEIWDGEELVGGLYGLKIGSVFCGESMFNRTDNAAKFAFYQTAMHLFGCGYKLIDCQIPNDFLATLGVTDISRAEYEDIMSSARTDTLIWPEKWETLEF